ncbi:MAG: nucleotidyltransferase family protein [Calditrichia bacterium]|nr:nucleotidyltransferase family protein [Calditrichia bacterium]
MKAMILAAGRGERLRPLTDQTPKPLLQIGGKALIEYHIENLVRSGINEIVINLSYLGEKIRAALGDGDRWGARIFYLEEGESALETGGGILHALPLLGDSPFVVVNGDIWTDFPFSDLSKQSPENPKGLAHLVLTKNPEHHPDGDFMLDKGQVHSNNGQGHSLTFTGIGVYHPTLFSGCTEKRFPLAPLLRKAMESGQVTGQAYAGMWMDIGTRQRLDELDMFLKSSAREDA